MQNSCPPTPDSAPAPRRRKRARLAVAWLFVGVVIGYPVAGLLASARDWDSVAASIPLRIGLILLSAWVWLTTRNPGRGRGGLWLAAFGIAYLVRLLWDIGVAQVPGAVEALAFFVATVAIPAAALWRGVSSLSEAQAMRLMFILGSAICLVALGMHTLGIGQNRSLTEATGRLSFEALNPITIGHTAVSTLISGLCMVRNGLKPGQAPLLIVGGLAAGTTLLLAASRGPLLCLAAAGLVFAVVTGRWFWLALITLALTPFLSAADSQMLARFSAIEQDQSALERLVLQANAIDQFLSRPVLGSAFIELELLEYPHNLFVETAMALGLVGLLLMLFVLAKAWIAIVRHVGAGQLLVALLFVQYFVAAQLSGAIFGHGALAAGMVLLLGANLTRKPRSGTRRDAPCDNRSMSTRIA
jgi:hypothetical protein